MRGLFWLLGLFAIAVGLSLVARYNEGYVLFFYPPYRIELSLTLFVLVLVVMLMMLYGIGHLFHLLINFPERVRAYRAAQARKVGQAAFNAAVIAQVEGRFDDARREAGIAMSAGEQVELATRIRDAALPIGGGPPQRANDAGR